MTRPPCASIPDSWTRAYHKSHSETVGSAAGSWRVEEGIGKWEGIAGRLEEDWLNGTAQADTKELGNGKKKLGKTQ